MSILRFQGQFETFSDPVLDPDEMGLDPATRELRVGDGTTAFASLPRAGSGTYERLGGASVTTPLYWVGKKVNAIRSGTPGRVKWLYFGDSYGQKIYQAITTDLRGVYGGRAGAGHLGAFGLEITNNATSGTVTANTTDFAVWPTGNTYTLGSAGASLTCGVGGVAYTCDTIKVIHANAGGGFKIRVDGVDNTTPTVTSDGSVTVTSISVTRGAHTVSVVQTSGTPKVVGILLEDSTLSGLFGIASCLGGISLSSATAQAWTNWTTGLTAIAPDVITLEMKESSASQFATDLDAFLTATQAACDCDIVLVQSPPVSGDDASQVAQNAVVRSKATQYGVLTWDSYSIFRDYATLTALGFNGDGTHVTTDCDSYRGRLMMRDLGIFAQQLYSPANLLAGKAYLNDRLAFGDPSADNGSLRYVNTDIAFYLGRALDFRDSAGTSFAYFDSRNSSANPSKIPTFSQVGAGAIVYGSAVDKLEVRKGGAISTYANVLGNSFVDRVNSASVSGAVTVDISAGGTQVLTLTGNVSSLTASNLIGSGQFVTLHIVQDATGGRTLPTFNSIFKWAGGAAPSWTTTAAARDIVTFEVVGANLYEVRRSLDVK